jgi:hypothetical protein
MKRKFVRERLDRERFFRDDSGAMHFAVFVPRPSPAIERRHTATPLPG